MQPTSMSGLGGWPMGASTTGKPGVVDDGGAGVTEDDGPVSDGVLMLLDSVAPAPGPNVRINTATPPDSAIAAVARDFIRHSLWHASSSAG
jgi:hypothetical protein